MFATLNTTVATELESVNLISSLFSNFFSIAVSVITVIAFWKLFEKAGEQGWKAIIPCYNNYMVYKIFWQAKWFWFSLIAVAVAFVSFIPLIITGLITLIQDGAINETNIAGGIGISIIAIIILVAGLIFNAVIEIILKVRIAKSFGKSGGFAAGLVFLTPIFLMILAFNKDKYKKIKD